MNRKGQVASMIFAVIAIFIVGILFFFSNHVVDQIYTGLENSISTSDFNSTQVLEPLQDIHAAENSMWDYAFLGVTMLLFGVLLLTAFSTRISVAFFWIYGVLSVIILALGVILSNIWQELAADPEFAVTITRFPITDLLLGTYFPTLVSGVAIVTMILLFGKRSQGT